MAENLIGKVTHWFGNINVAGIDLTDTLTVGDRIHVLGHTTDFEQGITSMQMLHQDVSEAKRGDSVGIRLEERARVGDDVFKVT